MTGTAAWNAIPGARGCTSQACAIRDRVNAFDKRGARVFGLSTQSPADQAEAAARLHLTYPLLSDQTAALPLPTFVVEGRTLFRRVTLLVHNGRVDRVLYPVFPPDQAAARALELLLEELHTGSFGR